MNDKGDGGTTLDDKRQRDKGTGSKKDTKDDELDSAEKVADHLSDFREEMRHSSDDRLRHLRDDVLSEQLIEIDKELALRKDGRKGEETGGKERQGDEVLLQSY